MPVREGMDVARVREIASQLQQSSETLANIGTQGRGQLSVLTGAWSGADLEQFSRSWAGAEKVLVTAGQTIQSLSKQLQAQAGEQEVGSSGSGSVLSGPPPGGPGGPGGPGMPGGPGVPDFEHPWIPYLDGVSTVTGAVGALDGINDITKAINGGRGAGALLSKIPAMTAPVLSPGARLGLFMHAQLTHPLFGKGAASLLGNPRMASLFDSSRVAALSKGFGRVMGPLALGVGIYDLAAGISEGDWSQAISGGMGLASLAAPLLIASGPVGWAVAGGLAVGSFVVSQWGDDIAAGAKKAWDWTGDRLSDVGSGVKNVAKEAGSVLSSGAKKLKGLFS